MINNEINDLVLSDYVTMIGKQYLNHTRQNES